MGIKYKNLYYADNLYGHAVAILADLNCQGVHLDIGCGYAGIRTGIIEKGLSIDYIGIDADPETVESNRSEGIESYQHVFGQPAEDVDYIEKILKGRSVSSISMLDVIEHLPRPEAILETIHAIALRYHVPAIISMPNVAHKDVAFKLLEGRFEYTETGLLGNTHLSFFTEDRLNSLMVKIGFKQICSNDVSMEKSDQHFPEDSTFLSEGSLVFQYLDWLKKLIDPNAAVNQFLRAYLPEEAAPTRLLPDEPKPFLSVITRTQGRRPQALTETLICLTGQTNTDFEVLIIGHKLDSEQQFTVKRIIEDLPEWIRVKTRLIKVDYGNRTTPLNVGFSESKGRYIAILDDDDIVFDNWVEEFYKLAQRYGGSVLHTYAISQNWMVVNMPSGVDALRACGSPKSTFCKDFDLLDELNVNSCPPVCLAFPAYAFQKLNIRFDENLTTTEDWDLLMRMAFLCGVSNSRTPTCIYRLWVNYESSQTVHAKDEWKANHLLIQDKFKRVPIILPPATAPVFKKCGDAVGQLGNPLILFVDSGTGFSESGIITAKKSEADPYFYEFPEINKYGPISGLRFDPSDFGMILIHDLTIIIETPRGTKQYDIKSVRSNGVLLGSDLVFVMPDPQMIVRFPEKIPVKSVLIQYEIDYTVPNEILDQLTIRKRHQRNIFYRALRKCYRLIGQRLVKRTN
jgi:Glycosyltransferases, probably involved in cell wall biogenesis